MPLRFVIPRQFHPPSSPLGRLLRHVAADARQAEALYLAAVVLLATGVLLAGPWAWQLVQHAGPAASWAYVAAPAAALGAGCLWGWKPAIEITAEGAHLHLRQGDRALTLWTARLLVESISALAYHRRWRRHAAVRSFVNRIPPELLLLQTDDGPVVIGLPELERERLAAHLQAARDEATLLRAARVA